MLTTEERRLEFVELVQSMRTAQKLFKSRDRENAEYYERQVDRALRRFESRLAEIRTVAEAAKGVLPVSEKDGEGLTDA